MSTTTLAAVLHDIKDLRVEERPVPELAPGKVLLRLHRGGICGTDIHYFEEGRFGSFAMTAQFIVGHEASGEVVAVGEGVTQPAVGQRVLVNPARQCRHCDYCRASRGNPCCRVLPLKQAPEALALAGAKNRVVKVQLDLL